MKLRQSLNPQSYQWLGRKKKEQGLQAIMMLRRKAQQMLIGACAFLCEGGLKQPVWGSALLCFLAFRTHTRGQTNSLVLNHDSPQIHPFPSQVASHRCLTNTPELLQTQSTHRLLVWKTRTSICICIYNSCKPEKTYMSFIGWIFRQTVIRHSTSQYGTPTTVEMEAP